MGLRLTCVCSPVSGLIGNDETATGCGDGSRSTWLMGLVTLSHGFTDTTGGGSSVATGAAAGGGGLPTQGDHRLATW